MASKDKKPPEKNDESVWADFKRRFKANPFIFVGTIVILVIVIVAFVLVPALVPNAQRGGIDLTFGSYNKTPIKYVEGNYFQQAYQNSYQNNQSSLESGNYQLTLYRIWREAFEATVVHTGILDEMKQAGYTAPENVVDREMAQLAVFREENGSFSVNKYRQMDNNRRLNLWRQLRDSIAISYYVSDLSGLGVPSGESAFAKSMNYPQRSFDFVSFPINSYPDSEVIAYAEANPALFQIAHFSKITVNSSEREAQQILDSIRNGTETFEDAARNKSRDYYAENSGDMGSRMGYELIPDVPDEQDRAMLMGLSRGSLSNVIKITDNSWAFFRVEEASRSPDTGDYITLEKIRNYVLSYERGRAEDWLVAEADKFIDDVKASDFDNALADRGMSKNSFGPLPINYGDISLYSSVYTAGITDLNNAGSDERFWRAGFSTPINTASAPVVSGSSVIILYPTEEITADDADSDSDFIEMYFSSWLNYYLEQNLQSYFLSNEKLDDRFWDVFQHFLY